MQGGLEIDDVLNTLKKSEIACRALEENCGKELLKQFKCEDFNKKSSLYGEICDFFQDEILNEADDIYGETLDSGFGIAIYEYQGVYFVQTADIEEWGYFVEEAKALDCLKGSGLV